MEHLIRPRALAWVALALWGCVPPKGAGGDDTVETGAGGDTGTPPPPCGEDGWGSVEPAELLYYVDDDAPGGGDGSAAAPFQLPSEALAAVRSGAGTRSIALLPGRYEESLSLGGEADASLQLTGCGADEVVLAPPEGEVGILLTAAEGVLLGGFTVEGGSRGVWVGQGSDAALRDLRSRGASRAGVVIDGSDSVVIGQRLEVTDVDPGGDLGGYGLSVQGAAVRLEEVSVTDATTLGVLVDGPTASLRWTGGGVTGTRPNGGTFGRGLQVQGLASAEVEGVAFIENTDAGVFALQATSLRLTDVQVRDTLPASLDDGADQTGDGVVVADGPPDASWKEPYFLAELSGVEVAGGARAGVLFSGNGVAATVTGVTSSTPFDPGAGASLRQDGAQVTGEVYDLDEAGTLLGYRPDALAPDDISGG